jgi:hypothetical protein
MNRRDFMHYTATSAGLLVPAWAQTAPCPPGRITAGGGTTANTACNPATAEADWVARSTAPGVKWAHDFRNAAEFTKFVVYNQSQPTSWLQRVTTDLIGNSACLEFNVPSGSHCNHSWPRPFSAFPGDVGYVSGPEYPSNAYDNWYKWRNGFYAHSSYHTTPNFVGTDFYIQFRLKFSSNFFNGNPSGKLAYIDIAGGGDQEIIVQAPAGFDQSNRFWMYTNFGSRPNASLDGAQGQAPAGVASSQPGGVFDAGCKYSAYSNCYRFPAERWVTVLMHVIPGRDNGENHDPDDALYKDTGIQVWIAEQGQTSYTKIWDKLNYSWAFDATTSYGNQFGFNIFTPSAYRNNQPSVNNFWYRMTQIIFSTQPIACPLV